MDCRFPAELRIKSRNDFQRVFSRGKVAADGTLVVHVLPGEQTRLGLSIPKKVGSAPVRNFWKRIIREAFRTHRGTLPQGLLIVVRPKKGAQADFQAVCNSLSKLVHRLGRQLR